MHTAYTAKRESAWFEAQKKWEVVGLKPGQFTAFCTGYDLGIKANCTHPNLQEQEAFPGNHYSTRIRFCDVCEEEVEEILEDAEAVYA